MNNKKLKKIFVFIFVTIISFNTSISNYLVYAESNEEVENSEDAMHQDALEATYEAELEDELDYNENNEEDLANTWEDLKIPDIDISQRFGDNIVFNSTDRKYLTNIVLVNSVLPELEIELNELADLTGKSIESLSEMQHEDYLTFYNLVKETESKYFTNEYIKNRLTASPETLGQILGTTSNHVINLLKDPSEVRYISSYIDNVLDIKLDRRIVQTLNYLVRPKDDPRGGAGHKQIVVSRLFKGYTRENSKYSRESLVAEQEATEDSNEELENKTIENFTAASDKEDLTDLIDEVGLEESETLLSGTISDENNSITDFVIPEEPEYNVSAHYKGMAVDVSAVDDIKCTLIMKRRVGSDKKTPQPPMPIKLLWQTKDGYSEDEESINSSFNQLFLNSSKEALLDMFSEFNLDFSSMDSLEGANFSDILSVVGQSLFSQLIDSSSDNIWKFDLKTTLRKFGGVLLAENLNLSREPFLDENINSIDGIYEAIGRYNVEKRLGFSYGALKSNSRDDLLSNIGEQKVLNELGLPNDIFNYEILDLEDFKQRVGSRIIEDRLALNKGSFYKKENLDQIMSSAGRYRIESLLVIPTSLDLYFNLPDGSSENFRFGATSPHDYVKAVAEANLPLQGDQLSGREKIYDLPENTITKLLSGDLSRSDLIEIGKREIAHTLENNDLNRTRLKKWLDSPNQSLTISESNEDGEAKIISLYEKKYNSVLNISDGDFYSIFGTNAASGVFKRLGETIVNQAIKDSSYVNQIYQNNPDLAENIETYEFYKERIETIKNHLSNLNASIARVKEQLDSQNDLLSDTKDNLKNSLDSVASMFGSIDNYDRDQEFITFANDLLQKINIIDGDITILQESIEEKDLDAQDLKYSINSMVYEIENIAKAGYEILTGKEQPDFRVGDTALSEIFDNNIIQIGGVDIGASDIILFLSGKISPEDLFIALASAKLGDELNLPKKALSYAAKVLARKEEAEKTNLKDTFFRVIGAAEIEEKTGINLESFIETGEITFSISFKELRDKLHLNKKISNSVADKMLLESFGLEKYNIDYLIRGDFGVWSKARSDAEDNDLEYSIPVGTTEKYIKGESLGKYDPSSLSADELREFSTKFGVSEAAVQTFIEVRDGGENPAINEIYYVDQNIYSDYENNPLGNDVCAIDSMPDNSYIYYDREGMHAFSSYPAANEYAKQHEDQKLDYIDELSIALAGESNSDFEEMINHFRKSLESFLRNNDEYAFQNAETQQGLAEHYFDEKGIETSVFNKIFSRDVNNDGEVGIDLLKILGRNLIKSFTADYISIELGIQIGSARITADDIYEIFNGNSGEVFTKIGAEVLGKELNVESGTIQNILLAESSDQRECRLEQAAMEIIGDALGIPGLTIDFSRSIKDNFGGARIENLLNLPEKSFAGQNINELLSGVEWNGYNGVPLSSFLKAFNVPLSKTASNKADDVLKQLGNNYYNTYKNKSIYKKVEIIETYISTISIGIGKSQTKLFASNSSLNTQLVNDFSAFMAAFKSWNTSSTNYEQLKTLESYKSYSDDELKIIWSNFVNRISYIDSALEIDSGSTEFLLKEKMTPDEYRNLVSDAAIENILWDKGGELLVKSIGLEGKIDSGDLRRFYNAIVNISQGNSIISELNSIYDFLNKIFSLNLDSKANFREGTFLKIIENPNNAGEILLEEGARILDMQFGLVGNDGEPKFYSFTEFTKIYMEEGASEVKERFIEMTKHIASNQISNFIYDNTKTNQSDGIRMPNNDIEKMFDGDIRPLSVVGMLWGVNNLIADDDNNLAVDQQFTFTYEDFSTAFYGNSELEDYARNMAYGQYEMQNQPGYNWDYPSDEDISSHQSNALPPNFDSGPVTGLIQSNDLNEATHQSINMQYGSISGTLGEEPKLSDYLENLGETAEDVYISEDPAVHEQYELYTTDHYEWTQKRDAGETAAQQVTDLYKKHLEYKVIDCTLRKVPGVGQYIPAGFTWAMQSGNSYIKTVAWVSFTENLLKDQDILPEGIDLVPIYNFFESPNDDVRGNLQNLVQSGITDALDSFLIANSPSIMGITLQPGTAEGLLAFIKTGDFNQAIDGIVPLGDLYSGDWVAGKVSVFADKKLGLPSGTTFKIYSMYKTLNKSKELVSIWSKVENYTSLVSGNEALTEELVNNYENNIEKMANDKLNQSKIAVKQVKAEIVSFILTTIFSDQIASFEKSIGLTPGSGSIVVGMMVQWAFGLPISPYALMAFVAMNLFGYYKTELICTADGYYPRVEDSLDSGKWDVAGLGEFDGMNETIKEKKFIEAAQYKANRLVGDLLEMPAKTGDETLVPTQIMIGRWEDVSYWSPLVGSTICEQTEASDPDDGEGVCDGSSRAGLWQNPQTTAWTHIGF